MASSFLSDFLPQGFVKRYLPRHVAAAPSRKAQFHLRNIYIVPTRAGLGLLVLVLLILIAAINFQNSMIYMVGFWLVSLLVINILYTFRNLSGLQLTLIGAEPCFAGQNCLVNLSADSQQSKQAIYAGWKNIDLVLIDLTRNHSSVVSVSYPAPMRGRLKLPRLDIFTRYPTGLTIAWAYARLDINVIVYPRPKRMQIDSSIHQGDSEAEDGRELARGTSDFSGLQRYQAGDNLHRVHWAKYAQTQKLYTKQFVDYENHELWLDWGDLHSGSIEQRLSHLCARVLECHAEQQSYGLKLPGKTIQPSEGETQRNICLTALALYSTER